MKIKKIVLMTAFCIPTYQHSASFAPKISDQFIERAIALFDAEVPRYQSCAHAIPAAEYETLKKILALNFAAQLTEKSALHEIKKAQKVGTSQSSSPLTPHWRNSLPDVFYDADMIPGLGKVFLDKARNIAKNRLSLFICRTYTQIFIKSLSKKKKNALSQKIAALINEENVFCKS